MAWYRSSSYISSFVAVIALVLTQLPPIIQWFPKIALDIQHHNKIGLNNAIGIIGHTLAIELNNSGNRSLNIEKVELEVLAPNGTKRILNAESFSPMSVNKGQKIYLPVNSVNIKPKESSSGFIFFNQNISPNVEENTT